MIQLTSNVYEILYS